MTIYLLPWVSGYTQYLSLLVLLLILAWSHTCSENWWSAC